VEFLSICSLFMMLIPLAIILFFAALGALVVVVIVMLFWLCQPSESAEAGNRFIQ
jgi:hypothetical protein